MLRELRGRGVRSAHRANKPDDFQVIQRVWLVEDRYISSLVIFAAML